MAMAVQRQRQRQKTKQRQDDEVVKKEDKEGDVNIASVVVSAPVPQSIQFLESATEDGNIDKERPQQQQGQHAAATDLDPPATEVSPSLKCVPSITTSTRMYVHQFWLILTTVSPLSHTTLYSLLSIRMPADRLFKYAPVDVQTSNCASTHLYPILIFCSQPSPPLKMTPYLLSHTIHSPHSWRLTSSTLSSTCSAKKYATKSIAL